MTFPSGITLDYIESESDAAHDVVVIGDLMMLVNASRDQAYDYLYQPHNQVYSAGLIPQTKGGNTIVIYGKCQTIRFIYNSDQLADVEILK